jgi:hypothetical protein
MVAKIAVVPVLPAVPGARALRRVGLGSWDLAIGTADTRLTPMFVFLILRLDDEPCKIILYLGMLVYNSVAHFMNRRTTEGGEIISRSISKDTVLSDQHLLKVQIIL